MGGTTVRHGHSLIHHILMWGETTVERRSVNLELIKTFLKESTSDSIAYGYVTFAKIQRFIFSFISLS